MQECMLVQVLAVGALVPDPEMQNCQRNVNTTLLVTAGQGRG